MEWIILIVLLGFIFHKIRADGYDDGDGDED